MFGDVVVYFYEDGEARQYHTLSMAYRVRELPGVGTSYFEFELEQDIFCSTPYVVQCVLHKTLQHAVTKRRHMQQ